jgi:hypothetical protein
MSHLTQSELDALQLSKLDTEAPFLIRWVSNGQLSIARHYGGCTFQKSWYKYMPLTDELIREDVVEWLAKYRKQQKKQKCPVMAWSDLF